MSRWLALLYGLFSYLVFFGTFLYAMWFVWTMDRPPAETPPLAQALLVNAGLLALFALQHSGMARRGFKERWTKIVPAAAERSTYVLFASLALLALVVFWQPLLGVVWTVEAPWARLLLHGLFWLGWLQVLVGTFLIDHFDLFGLKQVWLYFRGKPYQPPTFRAPAMYKMVRHPIYLGFLVAFWATPRMTVGHLFFSVMTTAYILLAIRFEERDLVHYYGEAYQRYRSGVSMLVPWPSRRKSP